MKTLLLYFILIFSSNFCLFRNQNIFDKKNSEDPSHLIQTFSVTELFGIVSLLYGMLLHSGAPVRRDASPPELPGHTVSLTCTAIRMLNQMAILDLKTFQVRYWYFYIIINQLCVLLFKRVDQAPPFCLELRIRKHLKLQYEDLKWMPISSVGVYSLENKELTKNLPYLMSRKDRNTYWNNPIYSLIRVLYYISEYFLWLLP